MQLKIVPVARAVCAMSVIASARPTLAQSDTSNVPRPPAAELEKLRPFLGMYEHKDQYWAGAGPWQGTIEVRSAVRGWYVEWIINTRFGPIDRQLRMLTTFDRELGRYRVWRFETDAQEPPDAVEAEARFAGAEFVMEWKNSRGPSGQRGTFRNRIRMEGPNELVIISEAEPPGVPVIRLGEWRNRRVP